MMKAIKLSAIFLIFVVGMILVLNWDSIFDITPEDDEDFVQEDLIDIKEECEKIRTAWESQTEWNEELYVAQRADIDQSKSMGMFSKEGFNTVNNCLRETATNKACDTYMAALKSSDFKDDRLQKHYHGVLAMKEAEKLDADLRVQNIEKIHALYTNIRNFSRVISPNFDRESANWAAFANMQARILDIAARYRSNPLYGELKQIPGFNEAMDQMKLKETTESQRDGFYQGLSLQIITYFKELESTPTQDNLDLMNEIYNRFAYEDGTHGMEELATIIVDMKSKVNN